MVRGMMSRRGMLACAAATAAALNGSLLAAACAGRQPSEGQSSVGVRFDQPVELAFWHTQTQAIGQALQTMVDTFNQTNGKRITVSAQYQGSYAQLFEKNMASLNAGTPVDLSVANDSEVAEYMRGGAVVDLDPYVKDASVGLTKDSLDDIFPGYLAGLRYAQYGNKLLAFPFTKSLVVMYVNDEVLGRANVKAVPKTWDDFAAAVQQASRGDAAFIVGPELGGGGVAGDPTRSRTYGWANYPSASTINAWAYSRGGTMLTPDGRQVRFTEPPYLESFQLTEEAFKRGSAYNPPRQPGTDYDFVSNHYAFIHQSSTSRPFLRRVMQDNGRQNMPWRITNIPQKDPSKPATVLYGANIAIFKTTPLKQAAAWEFIKWFTAREQDVQWSITSSYMPIRRSSADHPKLKAYWDEQDPQGRQAFEVSRYARPEPNVRGAQDIRPIIQNALQAVMEGKKTSRVALEDAAREANQVLQQAGA